MSKDVPVIVEFCFPPEADESVAVPSKQTVGSSCYDVRANFSAEYRSEGFILNPGRFELIPTGLQIALPCGYEAVVRPRSGLAAKFGITVLNSPGTIDSDYRGEVKVLLINFGELPYIVRHGERIAQLCFQKTLDAQFMLSASLNETERGGRGFGSSGKS